MRPLRLEFAQRTVIVTVTASALMGLALPLQAADEFCGQINRLKEAERADFAGFRGALIYGNESGKTWNASYYLPNASECIVDDGWRGNSDAEATLAILRGEDRKTVQERYRHREIFYRCTWNMGSDRDAAVAAYENMRDAIPRCGGTPERLGHAESGFRSTTFCGSGLAISVSREGSDSDGYHVSLDLQGGRGAQEACSR